MPFFIKKSSPSSPYTGVSWNTRDRRWYGQIKHLGESIYCGCSFDEKEAAKKVNEKCRQLGIPLKNPNLDNEFHISPFEHESYSQTNPAHIERNYSSNSSRKLGRKINSTKKKKVTSTYVGKMFLSQMSCVLQKTFF